MKRSIILAAAKQLLGETKKFNDALVVVHPSGGPRGSNIVSAIVDAIEDFGSKGKRVFIIHGYTDTAKARRAFNRFGFDDSSDDAFDRFMRDYDFLPASVKLAGKVAKAEFIPSEPFGEDLDKIGPKLAKRLMSYGVKTAWMAGGERCGKEGCLGAVEQHLRNAGIDTQDVLGAVDDK